MVKIEQINFSEVPYLYDQSGRIYLKNGKVYRLIEEKETIQNYQEILSAPHMEDLFRKGLIRTKINKSLSSNELMVLEHDRIPFILHPYEYTNEMFWNTATMFVKLNLELFKYGFLTQDSHPWNVSFNGNTPIFYDFGSIIKKNSISKSWLEEFFNCYIVPIWLASYSRKTYKFSKLYRKEHGTGFGIQLFKIKKLRQLVFRKFWKVNKLKDTPEKLFIEILKWLDKHKPLNVSPEYWSNYYFSHNLDYTTPESIKQKFVYDLLSKHQPKSVLDLASNKGYYSFMAAHLGADVMAFDYEEEVVNHLIENSFFKDRITPAQMDFSKPTAGLGASLFWSDSFTRFKSDIVLALGLIHHICITQGVPVYLFCETCKKYASKGIIIEYIDPTDKHVATWKKPIPKDYSINKISSYLKDKFPNCISSEVENGEGLNRTYLYYYL